MNLIHHPKISTAVISLFLTVAVTGSAQGDVQLFFTSDEWQDAVGAYSTITFTEYPDHTFITTQYQDLGVTFTDGNDFIYSPYPTLFVTDGAGLEGRFDDTITLSFDTPMSWLAVDYPGIVAFDLYSNGDLFYSSDAFGGGVGNFTGLLSTQPFDKVVIYDPLTGVLIDNLYFGGVPAPGALSLIAIVLLRSSKRRR